MSDLMTSPLFWRDLFCALWLPVVFAGWTMILLRVDAGRVSRAMGGVLVASWGSVVFGARLWLSS
jgi:hypothetical protein